MTSRAGGRFNPCFDGSFSSPTPVIDVRLPNLIVSILVLMEASLHRGWGGDIGSKERGFNPCFDGSFSSPRAASAELRHYVDVSILVLMEASLHLIRSPCPPQQHI